MSEPTDDWSTPDEKSAAKPKGKPAAKPASTDVLVENRRRGIFVAHHSTPKGKDAGGHETYDTVTHRLHPGLNFVQCETWARLEPTMRERMEASEVLVIDDFTALRGPAAKAAIERTGDVKVLRRLLANEKRSDIAEAIEKQIALAESGGARVRAAQDAHARR